MRNIDIVSSKPGIYIMILNGGLLFIESDEDGLIYQLEPHSGAYKRDGELRPGGWNIETIVCFHGPFARSHSTGAQQ